MTLSLLARCGLSRASNACGWRTRSVDHSTRAVPMVVPDEGKKEVEQGFVGFESDGSSVG